MAILPKRDWEDFRRRCQAADSAWLRGLSTDASIELYCSLFALAHSQIDSSPEWRAIEQQRWNEKLALRQKFVDAVTRRGQVDGT
jgi:hypothetical protein